MDFPTARLIPPPVLTPFNAEAYGLGRATFVLGGATSATWPANDKAYYYPFRLHEFVTARQLLFWVGATSSGNIDVAIYDSQLNRIVAAGSTAMSATVNTWQEINITDTVLPPGDYYLGVACSTTAGTCFMSAGLADEQALSKWPIYEQASALPLPNPAVPVLCTDATPPVMAVGIQFASVF